MRLNGLYGDGEQIASNAPIIGENEIVVNSEHKRIYCGILPVGSVYHGDVADETAMVALFTGATRGAFAGDWCYRTDTNSFWQRISNTGNSAANWVQITPARQLGVADQDSSGLPGSISDPPTQSEVQSMLNVMNNFITKFNVLLSRLRVTGGNGLLED